MEKGNGENKKNEALPISLFPPLPSAIPNNNPSAAYYRLYRSTSEQSSSGSVDCSKGDPEDQVSAMFVASWGNDVQAVERVHAKTPKSCWPK